MQHDENDTSNHTAASWAPLLSAFRDALENALQRAEQFAQPDEIETIARVRTFMRSRMDHQEARIDLDDLLFTFTLVMLTFDHDIGRLGGFVTWIRKHGIHIPLLTDLERQWIEQIVTTYEALQSRAAFASGNREATTTT